MFFYILLFFCFLIIYNFKKLKKGYHLYKIFKNTVDPNNEKNCCNISYDILQLIYKLFFSKTIDMFDKKRAKVQYDYNDKKFIYLLKVPKGVIPIDYIKDENGNDILNEIYPYLGPNLDCHNVEVYPRDFGLQKIIIKDIQDNEFIFEENDMIKIKRD